MASADVRDVVKEKIRAGRAAGQDWRAVVACGATAASGLGCDPITSKSYDATQIATAS